MGGKAKRKRNQENSSQKEPGWDETVQMVGILLGMLIGIPLLMVGFALFVLNLTEGAFGSPELNFKADERNWLAEHEVHRQLYQHALLKFRGNLEQSPAAFKYQAPASDLFGKVNKTYARFENSLTESGLAKSGEKQPQLQPLFIQCGLLDSVPYEESVAWKSKSNDVVANQIQQLGKQHREAKTAFENFRSWQFEHWRKVPYLWHSFTEFGFMEEALGFWGEWIEYCKTLAHL